MTTTPTPQPTPSWRAGLTHDELNSVNAFIAGWFEQGDPAEHAKALGRALAHIDEMRARRAARAAATP